MDAKSINIRDYSETDLISLRIDLIMEISENPELQQLLSEEFWHSAVLNATVAPGHEDSGKKYASYFDYHEKVSEIPSHRALAVLRGRKAGHIKINLSSTKDFVGLIFKHLELELEAQDIEWWKKTLRLVWKAKLQTTAAASVIRKLRQEAETQAIMVFAKNLKDMFLLAGPQRLEELVNQDPKSIGVGQYQHEVCQQKLSKTLNDVVIECVNSIGVDLNNASEAMLSKVNGITSELAKNIVQYREQNGDFCSLADLRQVSGMKSDIFEQASVALHIKSDKDPISQQATNEFVPEVSSINDLQIGMVLAGRVSNVANFGVFVDIGVKFDGLVHISSLANKFIKDPRDIVKAGELVKVKVTDIDLKRKRIGLSMRFDSKNKPKNKPKNKNISKNLSTFGHALHEALTQA